MFGASTFGTLAFGVGAGDEEAPPADHIATGVLLTQYGTPSHFTPNAATGVSVFNAGTPRGANTFRATGALVTRYGSPVHPHYQFGVAMGVQLTQAGVPYGWANPLHPGDTWTVTARGVLLTRYGQPEATANAVCVAAGADLARAGQPKAAVVGQASGAVLAQAGTPSARVTLRAQGPRLLAAGTPAAAMVVHAQGVQRTRAGTPRHIEPAGPRAYGVKLARYGRPTARVVMNPRVASGAALLAAGTPTAANIHQAFSLPPVTRAGQPIALRTPAC